MRLIDHALRVPGGPEGLAADLRAGRSRGIGGVARCDDPSRPPSIPFGRWRRMSRLTRLAAVAVLELRGRSPGLDWPELPVVWGSAYGEVPASNDFLDRLFDEGPDLASPLAFQGSVYNAPVAQLSMTLGLRGPTEATSCGFASGLAALARGADWLDAAEVVLVVVADDANASALAALAGHVVGEAVVAVLVGRGDGLDVRWGAGDATVARGVALPYEVGFRRLEAEIRPEQCLGLCPAAGLACLVAVGGVVVDQDGATAVTGSTAAR